MIVLALKIALVLCFQEIFVISFRLLTCRYHPEKTYDRFRYNVATWIVGYFLSYKIVWALW